MSDFPLVVEEEDRITVIYSQEPVFQKEDDNGVEIFYSRSGEVVKIIINKDDRHYIIYF